MFEKKRNASEKHNEENPDHNVGNALSVPEETQSGNTNRKVIRNKEILTLTLVTMRKY